MNGDTGAVPKKVKICGMKRSEDIDYANILHPDYVGFIIDFPKSNRSITAAQAYSLKKRLDPSIASVGVLVDERPEYAAELLESGCIDTVQLHGSEDNGYISELKRMTRKKIWQAFQIKEDDDILKANESAADFVILDGGQGSGHAFDWKFLKDIRRPFGLAGGLDIKTVPAALDTPAALLDVSGGVENEKGYKDFDKIKAFIEAVRR